MKQFLSAVALSILAFGAAGTASAQSVPCDVAVSQLVASIDKGASVDTVAARIETEMRKLELNAADTAELNAAVAAVKAAPIADKKKAIIVAMLDKHKTRLAGRQCSVA
jgi:hypothetical protein